MASNFMQACCTKGVKHEGTPTGTSIHLDNNIEAYIAEPTAEAAKGKEKKAILYLPDVIGIWENSKLMADDFARLGYYTLIPDYFNNDALALDRPADFDFMGWMTKGSNGSNPHTTTEVDPITASAIKYLQNKGFTRIGGVGYCFGAKYVVRFMSKTLPGGGAGPAIHVGYSAHPSFVDEEELAAIQGPYSVSAAETDSIFPTEKRWKSEEILIKTGQDWQINLLSGVEHGYAVRADLSDKRQKWSKEVAFQQAVDWMNFHL